MQQALFRKEALQQRTQRSLGSVRLVPPISHRYAMLASLSFGVALICWLSFGTYTRRVHATGTLVPRAGLIDVSSKASGIVTQIFVQEGQMAVLGQPLVTLSGERSSEALGDTSASIVQALRSDAVRIRADMVSARQLNDDQAIAFRKQQDTGAQQIAQIDKQLELQRSQIKLQEGMLEKVNPLLAKGYISAFQVQQQQSQLISAQAEFQGLLRQRADAAQQVTTSGAQLAQLPLQLETRLSELRGQLSTSVQALAQAEAERSVVLRAAQSGTVSSILIKEGQVAAQNQTVLNLIPQDSRLQAQLLVKSDAVGFLKIGTRVMVHLQAFPYQKFGAQHGEIEDISHSALSPQEVMVVLGQPQVEQQPLFRINVKLADQQVVAYGIPQQFKAGMAVDADLLLDKRRIIEWLFEPLLGMRKRYVEEHG
ncbi:HlyD family secretion protein [Luteibacter rhizovicinus]|nr:HlyD family efflux transporter periplasmic adaptor subunit [Luteibacter rhizovicinus]